jgi:hypothetical protein
LTLNELHGVISHEMKLFVTTAVTTSNPICESLIIVGLNKNYAMFKSRMRWTDHVACIANNIVNIFTHFQ